MRVSNRLGRTRAWLATVATAALVIGAAIPASAQLQEDTWWAVVDFADDSGSGMDGVGAAAADAVAGALAASDQASAGAVRVRPNETVRREASTLGLQPPLRAGTDVARLGSLLDSDLLFSGRVADWRLMQSGDSVQVQVAVEVRTFDVASGIVVNGANVQGDSNPRPGGTDPMTALEFALEDAAFKAVREILTRERPEATVLNTLNRRALLNQGARAGLREGQRVIVTRAGEQVAEGSIDQVDPDQSFLVVDRETKGVRPGDKVRVVFELPSVAGLTGAGNEVQETRTRGGGGGAATIASIAVLLGLAFFLFGQGRGSSTTLVHDVTAQAFLDPADTPAVRIGWRRDLFLRGNNDSSPFQWQVWRDDINTAPVAVASGAFSSVDDNFSLTNAPLGGNVFYPASLFAGSGTDCIEIGGGNGGDGGGDGGDGGGGGGGDGGGGDDGTVATGLTPLVAGRPYQYSVEVVYRVSSLSLPGDGGTGGGGTGGIGGGGGGTGGGDGGDGGNGGGGNGDGEFCYFLSERVPAVGLATPLTRPINQSPATGTSLNNPTLFSFSSVRGPVATTQLEYIVQFSTSPQFPEGSQTEVAATVLDLSTIGGGIVSTEAIDPSNFLPNAETVWWRVGVRNIADEPGPLPQAGGQRYMFGTPTSFVRAAQPPGPPTN